MYVCPENRGGRPHKAALGTSGTDITRQKTLSYLVIWWRSYLVFRAVRPFGHGLPDIPFPEPICGLRGCDIEDLVEPHLNWGGCSGRVVKMGVIAVFDVLPFFQGWESVYTAFPMHDERTGGGGDVCNNEPTPTLVLTHAHFRCLPVGSCGSYLTMVKQCVCSIWRASDRARVQEASQG